MINYDRVAMGSPLAPALAKLLLVNSLRIVHNNLNHSFTVDMWTISL